MDDHSYGHGSSCYWCGFDPDEDEDRPCDERLNKKPTAEEMAKYDAMRDLEEQIISIAADVGIGTITLGDAADRIRLLKPRTEQSNG